VNDIIKGDRELAKTLTWEVARYLGVCTSAISKAKNRTVPFSSF
jgi:hypothetical protein